MILKNGWDDRSQTPMWEAPPFDEARASFERYMTKHGFKADLIWVFREDVTNHRRQIWIRSPVPDANSRFAGLRYEYGRSRGFGVNLEVLCRVGMRSACYVWLSGDDGEGRPTYEPFRVPYYLKVPLDAYEVREVRSRWAWAAITRLNRLRGYDAISASLPSAAAEAALLAHRFAEAKADRYAIKP